MKVLAPRTIFYCVGLCLLLILVAQTYLVFDYFRTTRAALIRESDTILEQAFKSELDIRQEKRSKLHNEDNMIVPPPPTKENTIKIDLRDTNDAQKTIIGSLDLVINSIVSKDFPLNIRSLDSITNQIILSRDIHTKFVINIVDKSTSKILNQSNSNANFSLYSISSKLLDIDLSQKKALQLILINPFGLIMKRMSLMLISSFVLSILCLVAFRVLLSILAKQKQLVAFKNEFLTTIAHELKRPVASLTFNLDCLALPAYNADKEKRKLLIQRSVSATEELNDTINMIVALEKLQEGLLVLHKEPIPLNHLFEGLKEKFTNYPVKKVDIQIVCETDEITLTGDKNLLTQCFANLIDNAIKYSGNEVLITIILQKEGKWIVVSIKDNGFGIPDEKLPVIFDKYSRAHADITKINGFGIGLNYVKTIVEKHKGEVNVKSLVGTGSEFRVLLPE